MHTYILKYNDWIDFQTWFKLSNGISIFFLRPMLRGGRWRFYIRIHPRLLPGAILPDQRLVCEAGRLLSAAAVGMIHMTSQLYNISKWLYHSLVCMYCIYCIYKWIYAYMFMHLCLCIYKMYQCIYAVCRYVDGVRTYRYCFATSPFTCMYVCTYACMHVLICILYLMLVITDQGFYRVHPYTYCIASTYISSSHA